MAVYGYARVSTTRQADEGESLEVQRRTMEGYALMNGLALDHVFVERGVSGSKALGDRPEGARLLEAIAAGDTIITPKLDRAFRSALDALDTLRDLQKRGVSLHMVDLGGDVTKDGVSKLVFTILSAVAESERERIAERVATVKADQRKRGRYLGGSRPFGWRIGESGELEPVEDEQAAIQRMQAMRAGGDSLRKIATAMQADGFQVSHMVVKRALEGREAVAA